MVVDLRLPDPERYIMFGDGCLASLWDVKSREIDHVHFLEFEFSPTKATFYRWHEEFGPDRYDNPQNGTFIRRYKKSECKLVDPDFKFQKWLILAKPNGERTTLVDDFIGEYKTQFDNLEKENTELYNQLAKVHDTLLQMAQNPEEFERILDAKVKRRVDAALGAAPGGKKVNEEEQQGGN